MRVGVKWVLYAIGIMVILLSTASAKVCVENGVSIRFKPKSYNGPRSFFTEEGTGYVLIHSKAVPRVIVQVLDSSGTVDRTISGVDIIVTASPSDGVNLQGNTAVFRYGEAHFTKLTVESATEMFYLNFTVQKSLYAIEGKSLVTGQIESQTATTWSNDKSGYHLAFSLNRSSVAYPGDSLNVWIGEVLPTIRIRVLTPSFALFDTDAEPSLNNLTIVASCLTNTSDLRPVYILNNLARVIAGEAIFDNLILQSESNVESLPPMTFSARRIFL